MDNKEIRHPCKFSDPIIDHLARYVEPGWKVLDPFAGIGRVHELRAAGVKTVGIEIEPEWAAASPFTEVGNALDLRFKAETFDAIVTSPCLAQSHRILTDDLRWVEAGDIEVGDKLLAFDEHGPSVTAAGRQSRRRWRRTEVVRSTPRRVRCVRVILDNGDEIITTPEHPWLASRYSYGGMQAEWIQSQHLMGSEGRGTGRGHNQGARQPYFVHRQVEPWHTRRSYNAGWLSGIFDGEGSVSLGTQGSPKMQMCQVEGEVLDRAERLMHKYGYAPNRIARAQEGNRQKVVNLYITGGFPGLLRALGELRPVRLLNKWESLDISSRTVEAGKIAVVGVEPAGLQDIQEIETTEGTYFGEGYLHHNCYGNRTADHHKAKDNSRRITYRHTLGRELSEDNAGQLHWGPHYRAFHVAAWLEAVRVLKTGGVFFLNISDHIRKGERMHVSRFHADAIRACGCRFVLCDRITTKRMRFGANYKARVPFEYLLVFVKEG